MASEDFSVFDDLTQQQQTDVYDALLQALGPAVVPQLTDEDANTFNDYVGSLQGYLNPINPGEDPAGIPTLDHEPDFSNFVLAKDIFPYWDDVVEAVGPVRKKRYSNYFITINTNRRPPTADPYSMADKFRTWLANFVFTNAVYKEAFVLNNGADEFNDENVDKITTLITVEVGSKQKRLHAHILMNVAHYSVLKVDFRRFKNIVDSNSFDASIRSYYINWQLGRDKSYVIDYMAKRTIQGLQKKGLFDHTPSLKAVVGGLE